MSRRNSGNSEVRGSVGLGRLGPITIDLPTDGLVDEYRLVLMLTATLHAGGERCHTQAAGRVQGALGVLERHCGPPGDQPVLNDGDCLVLTWRVEDKLPRTQARSRRADVGEGRVRHALRQGGVPRSSRYSPIEHQLVLNQVTSAVA